MRYEQSLWITCLPLLVVLVARPLQASENGRDSSYQDQLRRIWGQDMKDDFDADALKSLASKPSPSRSEQGEMLVMILHAAVKKDPSFQGLLNRPELRKSMPLDMVLSGYDYAVNKSEGALDHILAQLATEDIGSDATSIVVLSVLDEWDRTIRAFRKHFVRTDGAGGACMAGFLAVRAHLYPKEYAEMREAIEAPIHFTSPLLPRKR